MDSVLQIHAFLTRTIHCQLNSLLVTLLTVVIIQGKHLYSIGGEREAAGPAVSGGSVDDEVACLSDVCQFDTDAKQWMELPISGPPSCKIKRQRLNASWEQPSVDFCTLLWGPMHSRCSPACPWICDWLSFFQQCIPSRSEAAKIWP